MFKKKQKNQKIQTYDRENKKPVLKCSICTGEQVAGFQDIHTGKFEEVMLVKDEKDREAFMELYGIRDSSEITKVY